MSIYVNGQLVAGTRGHSSGNNEAGVISFNGRDGQVIPTDGDYTAKQISFEPEGTGMTSKNVDSAIKELFMSGSNGKSLIASAITAKGVNISADATFEEMANGISNISSMPDDIYKITLNKNPSSGGSVSGGGLASAGIKMTISATANDGYDFIGWTENDSSVTTNQSFTFNVTNARIFTANFKQDTLGVVWNNTTIPVYTNWKGVCYGNDKFVAVGTIKTGAYSTDGIDWKSMTLPGAYNWADVAYGNGKFVAIGNDFSNGVGYGAYSTNGTSWSSVALPNTGYPNWMQLIYANGKFVALSDTALGVYSTNGTTWTEMTMPSSQTWSSIAYGNNRYVAIAKNSNKFAYSADAISWTQGLLPSSQNWSSVAYGNGRFVLVSGTNSSSDKALYSLDGITWLETTLPYSRTWSDIAYGSGKFIATAWNSSTQTDTILAYSKNGIEWNTTSADSSYGMSVITYGNDKFVALGTGGGEAFYSEA